MAKTKGVTNSIDSDQTWKHEQDARTLAEAAGIKADPKRMGHAVKHAKKMADTKMAEAKELKKLGNKPRF